MVVQIIVYTQVPVNSAIGLMHLKPYPEGTLSRLQEMQLQRFTQKI